MTVQLEIFTAASLIDKRLPVERYIVPRRIPEGTTLVVGKPKIGKSWFLLNIAVGIATGTSILGETDIEGGDVLYLALEDNQRRLQKRLRQMLNGAPAPDNLHLSIACPPLDQGAVPAIAKWCDSVPKPRLIIIDVIARVRPAGKAGERLYDADYSAIIPLKKIADERHLALLICHHARKEAADDPFDAVSGTTGLAAAADAVLVLDRSKNGTTLYGRGRDLEEFELALRFDGVTGVWKVLGDASAVRRSTERNKIIDAIKDAGTSIGPKEITDRSGLQYASVRHLVRRMVRDGDVTETAKGRYEISSPHHTVHSIHTP